MYEYIYNSPIGDICIQGTDEYITRLYFVKKIKKNQQTKIIFPVFVSCIRVLDVYFKKGTVSTAEVDFIVEGTELQKTVWQMLLAVKPGKVISYTDLAKKAGYPKAVRAVASAVAKNPLYLLIPCHRVVPKNGGIGNYGGGAEKKDWLLKHEGVCVV